jgi:hypothetical protein
MISRGTQHMLHSELENVKAHSRLKDNIKEELFRLSRGLRLVPNMGGWPRESIVELMLAEVGIRY